MSRRWENKGYLKFVSELPCANCGLDDDTTVAHHLKGRGSWLSGGTGYKASDWCVMPFCYKCHTKAHIGDVDVLDWQFEFILRTLDKAFNHGVLSAEYKQYEHYNIL